MTLSNELPGESMPSNTAALHGVTVLDFSHVMAGPFATYYLATLGARVIKIENPARGDSLRGKPKSFHAFNHGKEILALDLSTDQGRTQAWDLFASSDVMVDNMRPGVMEKWLWPKAGASPQAQHDPLQHQRLRTQRALVKKASL